MYRSEGYVDLRGKAVFKLPKMIEPLVRSSLLHLGTKLKVLQHVCGIFPFMEEQGGKYTEQSVKGLCCFLRFKGGKYISLIGLQQSGIKLALYTNKMTLL